jgi:hypothetical protein
MIGSETKKCLLGIGSPSENYKKYSPTAEACPAADGTNLRLKTADKLGKEFALKINRRQGMGVCPRTRNITQVAGQGLPGGRRDQSPPKNGG